MNRKSMTDRDIKELLDYLGNYINIEKTDIYLVGSRCRNTETLKSDMDIYCVNSTNGLLIGHFNMYYKDIKICISIHSEFTNVWQGLELSAYNLKTKELIVGKDDFIREQQLRERRKL
ncbi:MAG: hypothetical protein ACMXYC_04400 [Candidatus Woesearchaeota archaeon]